MDVTVLVFNGVSSREVVAPLTALDDVQGCTVRWVAREPGTVYGFEPVQRFDPIDTVDDVADTDMLLIPGGMGSIRMMEDPEVVAWVAASAERARIVMSVSTGSLLLAAAGLLQDRDASGHWLAAGTLEAAGAHPSEEAITWQGNIVTTSGAMAAAEVAATLPEKLAYGATD
jgi:putative intracellular protease/amidase